MANSLLTTSKITREAVDLFVNSNMFIRNIDRQYDDEFGKKGEKIGSQLRIRLPNDYTVTRGPAASVQDTAEVQTVLTMAYQDHVDVSFSQADLLLSLDDFSERVLSPMMNNLAGDVAFTVMSAVEGNLGNAGICNFQSNVNGSGAIIHPNQSTILYAKSRLEDNSTPPGTGRTTRKLVYDPWSESAIVSSLTGLFNPTPNIGEQYRSGQMKNALGFDFYMDQTVIKHTTGTFTVGTVNGANQTGAFSTGGQALTVNAITGTLNIGDIFTIAGVFAVNRVTKQTTGMLRQFVVVANAASGATSLQIYPSIIPAVGGNAQQYQTVTVSPANGAAITLATQPSEVYRKGFAYAPQAITLATGDLPLPDGVEKAARAQHDGISMRMVTQYAIGTDQSISRVDVLYGFLLVRPEWACIVADTITP